MILYINNSQTKNQLSCHYSTFPYGDISKLNPFQLRHPLKQTINIYIQLLKGLFYW